MQTHLVVSDKLGTMVSINLLFVCEEFMANKIRTNSKSHMPKDSLFFEKIVPISLITMGIVTLGLILFAAGVILGIVHF